MKAKLHAPLRLAALAGATVLPLLLAAPASAQESGGGGWPVTLGLGAQTFPKFPGSDSYGINPYPIFGLRREGRPLSYSAADDGAGFGLLGQDSLINFGPALRLQTKREQDDVGAPVGDVPLTFEAGGFVQIMPSRNFRLRAELRRGIGGHDGWVGSAGADLIIRDDNTYIFAIGPRVRWADRQYQNTYFGTPAIPASGIPTAFTADSGIYAVGGTASFVHKLGRNWGVQAYAGYDRLVRDAADSPIVRGFGSRDQFSGGAGLFLEFNVGGHHRR